MRCRTEAEIFVTVPVFQVVARLSARQREIADFVLRVSLRIEVLDRPEVHIRLGILIGKDKLVSVLEQWRSRLKLQVVERDMLDAEPCDVPQIPHERIHRLSRDTEHEVYADVVKSRFTRHPVRLLEIGTRMDARQCAKLAVVAALKPDAESVHPRTAQFFQHIRSESCGIRLDRELRICRKIEVFTYTAYELHEKLCREHGRRSSADIDRITDTVGGAVAVILHMEEQRLHIMLHDLLPGGNKRIKVAVRALAPAERYVKIQSEDSVTRPRSVVIVSCKHQSLLIGRRSEDQLSSSLSTAMNASGDTCTLPSLRIFFLPSFCFSSSFFFRVISPP